MIIILIHRIHKWRTRGKKLVPSHESEALEGKQKLQMKTFSELAKCLARIPPKITLYGLLFKYNYVGCLLLLMFRLICCLQSKGSRISEARQVGDGWRKAANMLAQTSHWNRVRKPAHYNLVKQKYKQIWVARKKEISDGYMAYLLMQETSAIEQNSSSRDGKKRRQERSRDWGFD